MRRLLIASCLISLTLSSPSLAAKRGQIGGPPTRSPVLRLTLQLTPPKGPVVVIGRGRAAGGRIEIVAYNSRFGLCVLASRPRLLRIGDVDEVGCGSSLQAASGVVELQGASKRWSKGHGWLYSDQWGAITPAVGTVSVRMQLRGKLHPTSSRLIYARPDPLILARLHQVEPIHMFLAAARGCAFVSKTQATAFDYTGLPIGSAQSPFPSSFDDCRV